MDDNAIEKLDDILDAQGGFTKEAAKNHLEKFGPFGDLDVLLEQGCFAMLPEFESIVVNTIAVVEPSSAAHVGSEG